MGHIVWKGGESFEIELMGTMREILRTQITSAIHDNPEDPGGAIQGVLDQVNELVGESKIMQWVRT